MFGADVAVIRAVPNRNRDTSLIKVEAPRLDLRKGVITPADNALAYGVAHEATA
jgi:hypothetical protein